MFTTLLATTAAAYVDPLFPLRQRYAANASANGYQKTTAVGPYPEGFAEEDYHGTEGLISGADTALTISGNVRAYWVQDSNQHSWDTIDFQKLDLRGKSLRWTTDVSKVGCACNAALYLVAMPSKGQGDNSGYCDIQGVGGEYCLEIDLFEGNQKAMQATLHTQQGQVVDGSCNQYGCAVNWGKDDQRFYGAVSSAMIDSRQAFEMDAAFDEDGHMTVRVRQEGSKTWHDYWTPATAGNPSGSGVPEAAAQATKQALSKGVVLTVSLWEAQDDMAWLNGNCNAQYAPLRRTTAPLAKASHRLRTADARPTRLRTDIRTVTSAPRASSSPTFESSATHRRRRRAQARVRRRRRRPRPRAACTQRPTARATTWPRKRHSRPRSVARCAATARGARPSRTRDATNGTRRVSRLPRMPHGGQLGRLHERAASAYPPRVRLSCVLTDPPRPSPASHVSSVLHEDGLPDQDADGRNRHRRRDWRQAHAADVRADCCQGLRRPRHRVRSGQYPRRVLRAVHQPHGLRCLLAQGAGQVDWPNVLHEVGMPHAARCGQHAHSGHRQLDGCREIG